MTFAERKQARIAAGTQNCVFRVTAQALGSAAQVVGTFKSRKSAEDFAFAQINGFGDTLATNALRAVRPRNEVVNNINCRVDRAAADAAVVYAMFWALARL